MKTRVDELLECLESAEVAEAAFNATVLSSDQVEKMPRQEVMIAIHKSNEALNALAIARGKVTRRLRDLLNAGYIIEPMERPMYGDEPPMPTDMHFTPAHVVEQKMVDDAQRLLATLDSDMPVCSDCISTVQELGFVWDGSSWVTARLFKLNMETV